MYQLCTKSINIVKSLKITWISCFKWLFNLHPTGSLVNIVAVPCKGQFLCKIWNVYFFSETFFCKIALSRRPCIVVSADSTTFLLHFLRFCPTTKRLTELKSPFLRYEDFLKFLENLLQNFLFCQVFYLCQQILKQC